MARVTVEESDKKAQEASQGLFLKLDDDGWKAIVVFVLKDKNGESMIEQKDTIFNEKTNKTEDYDPKVHQGNPQTKFVVNMFVLRTGVPGSNGTYNWTTLNKFQLFNWSSKSWKLARASMEKYKNAQHPIEGLIFEVERKGKARDSKTFYTCLPDEPRYTSDVPGLDEMIRNAKMIDPSKQSDERTESTPQQAAAATNAAHSAKNDVIDPETANQLIARIRALPDSAERVQTLLNTCGVSRIKEIKNTDLSAALKLVDGWEKPAQPAQPPQQPAAVQDPFA